MHFQAADDMSKTAQKIVDDIVIGWNLGNTLEEFKAISFALSIPLYFFAKFTSADELSA